ncbi:MAG: hypothetical protein U1E78_00185 [Gammaproteobacteria bacterium]
MNIYALRRLAGREEIDYPFLLQALSAYQQPRKKIQSLLASGDLIRIKKGLYIFGERVRKEPYAKEVLANLIYGPSALSLEYALSYYGLIPERVETLTSITNNRNKHFETPVGSFDYSYLTSKKYALGIAQIQLTPQTYFLMATKEKALADFLMLRSDQFESESILHEHLVENLRIEERILKHFDYQFISRLVLTYKNKNVTLLKKLIEKHHA